MKTQKILSGLRIGVLYAVGIFTALLCVFSLSEGRFLPGLFFGIAALWVLPVTQRFLNAKFRFPRWVNWAAPISTLLVALIALGMSLPTPNRETVSVQPIVKDTTPTTVTAPVVAAPVDDVSKHPMFAFLENSDLTKRWVDSVRFFRPISSLSVTDSVKVTAIQKRWIAKTLGSYKKDNLNFFTSGLPVTLDSVVFTVSPKKAKEWVLAEQEVTQTWSWYSDYFEMLKGEGLPYLPLTIKFVRPKGMNSPFHIASQGWEKADSPYMLCTIYMGEHDEKKKWGYVSGGVKKDGEKYLVVQLEGGGTKLYKRWGEWDRYAFYYDRTECTSRNGVDYEKLN